MNVIPSPRNTILPSHSSMRGIQLWVPIALFLRRAHVCVDILGTSNTSATATSSISTPSPIQTGMTSLCDEFHLVETGDECSTIADQYSIALADFYSWNPVVGTSCTNFELGEYVCVGVEPTLMTTLTDTVAKRTAIFAEVDSMITPAPKRRSTQLRIESVYSLNGFCWLESFTHRSQLVGILIK